MKAVPNNQSVTLTWSIPANNTGSNDGIIITGYEIQQDDNQTEFRACTESTIIIKQLTNGNEYSFKIRAVNDAGKSEWSNVCGPVIPCTAPSEPTNLTAVPGKNSMNLTWNTPANNGGSAITGYKIQVDLKERNSGEQKTSSGSNDVRTLYLILTPLFNLLRKSFENIAHTHIIVIFSFCFCIHTTAGNNTTGKY